MLVLNNYPVNIDTILNKTLWCEKESIHIFHSSIIAKNCFGIVYCIY